MAAISTYSDLKSAIQNYVGNSSFDAEQAVQLGEAYLNRELKAVVADVTLTGTVSSRRIDVSAYNVVEAIALYLTTDGDEEKITLKADGTFPYLEDSGEPNFAALDENNDYLDLNRPCDVAHTFRFRYRGRFALSDSVTTNQMLTDHPDVYLAACLVWGGIRHQDAEYAASMRSLLMQFVAETRHYLAQGRRGVATVDPALAKIGNAIDPWWYQQ